ncbi:hypothetical protein HU200_038884 [Digitaria exilis]|uniref:Uncharacterized protein n=1 Tax=Digitaria exilis TaxID=1010633 RepID=A0A835BN78_9POAL|nr:hypothetical protein HU200_038884 [Digitaria exilis]
MPETAAHMMATCSYSAQVWNSFTHIGIVPQQLPPNDYRRLLQWWTCMTESTHQPESIKIQHAVIYTAWNIWKERCRRVFDNKEMTVPQLVLLIKQDIQNWHTTHACWEE